MADVPGMPDEWPRAHPQVLADANAVGRWYATTHGNGFEHDHHCPWARMPLDHGPKSEAPGACTCGWAEAEPALSRLAEASSGS